MSHPSPHNPALGRLVSMPLYGIIPSVVGALLFAVAAPGVYWSLPLPLSLGLPAAATIGVLSGTARSLSRARDGETSVAPEGASVVAVFATLVGACGVGVGALKVLFNGFMGSTPSPGDNAMGLVLMLVPMALAATAAAVWRRASPTTPA